MRATFSSLRPSDWRRSLATWAAKGNPMSSALTASVRMTRISSRPLFCSCVQA